MDHADRFDDLISFLTETEVEQCTKFVKLRSVNDYSKTLDDLEFGKHEYSICFRPPHENHVETNVYPST